MSEIRCRVGDICIVVNDIEMPCNNGALVEILRVADPKYFSSLEFQWDCKAISSIRFGSEIFRSGAEGFGYRDRELFPIRPGEGEDEMVQLLGKPQEVAA